MRATTNPWSWLPAKFYFPADLRQEARKTVDNSMQMHSFLKVEEIAVKRLIEQKLPARVAKMAQDKQIDWCSLYVDDGEQAAVKICLDAIKPSLEAVQEMRFDARWLFLQQAMQSVWKEYYLAEITAVDAGRQPRQKTKREMLKTDETMELFKS